MLGLLVVIGMAIAEGARMTIARLTAIALVVATLLAACTSAPQPSPTMQHDDPDYTPRPEVSEVSATIVVAGPDTDGESVSASGYVAGIVEDGGICMFVFTDETGGSASVGSVGEADRSTTSCGLVRVPRNSLVKGTWTVALNYEALDSSTVSSPEFAVEVP